MTNSEEFDGLSSGKARQAIVDRLARKTRGEHKVTYRLRDWLVSDNATGERQSLLFTARIAVWFSS